MSFIRTVVQMFLNGVFFRIVSSIKYVGFGLFVRYNPKFLALF